MPAGKCHDLFWPFHFLSEEEERKRHQYQVLKGLPLQLPFLFRQGIYNSTYFRREWQEDSPSSLSETGWKYITSQNKGPSAPTRNGNKNNKKNPPNLSVKNKKKQLSFVIKSAALCAKKKKKKKKETPNYIAPWAYKPAFILISPLCCVRLVAGPLLKMERI